ncbi:MAG: GNAT family N-acetyltransferase [Clostridia bacterium]|nr:GNAT family N-acetyltransferase [Clostridia bacterium]
MEYIKFEYERKYVKEFINLSKKIYSKSENMENKKEIEKLLLNVHPLSKYFHLDKFLIYDDNKVVGRFCITTYPDDTTAYIGFFECVKNNDIAKFLFETAYNFAKEKSYKELVGPVDASFWIKYRLKINAFDKMPYTGEPYNKDYYYKMFLENGYEVTNHYISNIFPVITEHYINGKFEERYENFTKNGYEIISPDLKNYDKLMEELYYMITELYSDFPIYKHLSLEDFKDVFSGYKYILNTDMVRFAYYNKKPVGFYISVPNYNNKVYHLNNLFNLIDILKIRESPKEYVMLYMGADKNHKGLGKALVGAIEEELKKNKLPSIGALARDGKITQTYGTELVTNVYEYVLMRCKIDD